MKIHTILFDLGNVLLDFSHENMCQQVAEVFGVSSLEVKQVLFDEGLSYKYETGELTEAEAHRHLEEAFQRPCGIEILHKALGDIFTPKPGMNSIVRSLQSRGIRLVLLSNTCESHIEWIRKNYEILGEFDHLILSYEVGACKPDEAIFSAALENINCLPEECLYTDDIPEYIEAARKYGLNAEVFIDSTKFLSDLEKYGIQLNLRTAQ